MKALHAIAICSVASLAACGHPATSPGADWPSYNGNLRSQRYSSLDQITTHNAASLKPVCSVKLKEAGALQAGPVVIAGTLYVTTAHDTYAIDAATCALKWTNSYTPQGPVPYPVDRGVAVSGSTLVRGQVDGHLTAMDVATGKTLWNVAPASGARGEFLSSAPIIWNNTVYIGTAGSDWGAKGRMMAFDLATGKQVWTFSTIATGNDPNAKSWKVAKTADTGGGGLWTSYTIDPDAGELFISVANPGPDYAPSFRPGSNLYTDSVIALDAKTGTMKWFHQMIANDGHDWDMGSTPVLYTTKGGTAMVAAAGKDGFIYGLDRASHKVLYSTPEIRILNYDKPPTITGVRVCPGVLGGSEWNGPAWDEKDGTLITPMNDWCATLKLGSTRYIPGQFYFGGSAALDPRSSARGTLTATDATTGKIIWQYTSSSPMLSGVTPTAGGVTFAGDMAGNLMAFDSSSGKVLYKDKTQGSIAGGVVTYLVNGKQYVAATSGNISRLTWGAQGVPSIVIYAL